MNPLLSGWTTAPIRSVTTAPEKIDPAISGRASVRYVDIGLLDGPTASLHEAPFVDAAKAPSRCRQVLEAGDTIYSTVRPYLRKIAFIGETLTSDFASTGFSVLRPTRDIEPRYLYYFTLSQQFESQILPKQKGVSYPAVLDREVRACQISYPSRQQQRRIVTILEDHLLSLDAARAYLHQAMRRAASLEAAIRSEARRGPERQLPDVAAVQGGIQKQQRRAPRYNAYPFLRVANVTAQGLDLSDVHRVELFDNELSRLRLQRGDLLVVEGNGSASQIGRAALWDGSIEDCVHQNHLIRVRPGPEVLPEYLEAVWNSPQTRAQLTHVASSSSGLHTLSVSKLKALTVPVPDMEHQERIVFGLRESQAGQRRLLLAAQAALMRGEALRRAVLAAAFSGLLTGQHTDNAVIEELAQ